MLSTYEVDRCFDQKDMQKSKNMFASKMVLCLFHPFGFQEKTICWRHDERKKMCFHIIQLGGSIITQLSCKTTVDGRNPAPVDK